MDVGILISGSSAFSRDRFKKIRDTKGTFHVKMGLIKDRNGMNLTEAEDIKEIARKHRGTIQKKS